MADIIADRLEGKLGIDEPLNTGMSKRVRAGTPDANAGFAQIVRRAARYAVPGQGHPRSEDAQEDLAVFRLGSCVLEVVEQLSLSYFSCFGRSSLSAQLILGLKIVDFFL